MASESTETETAETKPGAGTTTARKIGRAFWRAKYESDNPSASKEEMAAAWKSEREAYTKAGRRAIRDLKKDGFKLVAPK